MQITVDSTEHFTCCKYADCMWMVAVLVIVLTCRIFSQRVGSVSVH
jgi:hypothetical protein